MDADGDPCTGNDGSWKCGIFDSYESFISYYDINEDIAAQKENENSLDAASESSNIDTTFPTYPVLGSDEDSGSLYIDTTFPTYFLGFPVRGFVFDEDVTYAYKGQRSGHMSTHGVCEDNEITTHEEHESNNNTTSAQETTETTTAKATTTSSQKLAILFLPLFIFTLTL